MPLVPVAMVAQGNSHPFRCGKCVNAPLVRFLQVAPVVAMLAAVMARGLLSPPLLACLHTWLRLDPSGQGGLCLAPGDLRAVAPGLLPALIGALGGAGEGGGGAGGDDGVGAASAAGELVAAILGPGRASATAGADIEALRVSGVKVKQRCICLAVFPQLQLHMQRAPPSCLPPCRWQ